jgi:hypothetical protein
VPSTTPLNPYWSEHTASTLAGMDHVRANATLQKQSEVAHHTVLIIIAIRPYSFVQRPRVKNLYVASEINRVEFNLQKFDMYFKMFSSSYGKKIDPCCGRENKLRPEATPSTHCPYILAFKVAPLSSIGHFAHCSLPTPITGGNSKMISFAASGTTNMNVPTLTIMVPLRSTILFNLEKTFFPIYVTHTCLDQMVVPDSCSLAHQQMGHPQNLDCSSQFQTRLEQRGIQFPLH